MPRSLGGTGRALGDSIPNIWFSHNLELVTDATGAAGAGEVVARPAARTPHPTRAGGQDDGSYTNSLKRGSDQVQSHPIGSDWVCDCIRYRRIQWTPIGPDEVQSGAQ